MRKWKTALGAMLVVVAMLCNFSVAASGIERLEADSTVTSGNEVAPRFLAIIDCGRTLTLENSAGKMYVLGYTDTYFDYNAGVRVEIERYNGSGSWTSLQSWEDIPGTESATVSEFFYVGGGTYRAKVTHYAYTKAGTLIETFEEYTYEVTY